MPRSGGMNRPLRYHESKVDTFRGTLSQYVKVMPESKPAYLHPVWSIVPVDSCLFLHSSSRPTRLTRVSLA